MSLDPIGAIAGVPPAVRSSKRAQPVGAVASAPRPQDVIVDLGAVPSAPPESLDAELRVAAKAMGQLRARGQTLHFEADPERRRVRIEIRDLEGNVLRTIPPSEAMAIAAGRMAE